MHKFVLTYGGFSILIPLLVGLVNYSRATLNYRLFVILLGIGACNDFFSSYLISTGNFTIVNNNIYVLIESVMLILFFKASGAFTNSKAPIIIIVFLAAVWIVETSLRSIHDYSTYFRILYSFITVLISIKLINILLGTSEQTLIKHPTFLICIAFVIYYTLNAMNNAFWLYGVLKSNGFLLKINTIMVYMNVFINLIYALALLWIPKKQASLLPS